MAGTADLVLNVLVTFVSGRNGPGLCVLKKISLPIEMLVNSWNKQVSRPSLRKSVCLENKRVCNDVLSRVAAEESEASR